MSQGRAFVSDGILGAAAIVTLGSLGAVLATGCVAVGNVVGVAVSQGRAFVSDGILGATALVALGSLSAVLAASCVAVGNVVGVAMIALNRLVNNIDSVNAQICGEISVAIIEGQQAIQIDLVVAGSGSGAGEGQDDGVLGEGSSQVIGTGPHHGRLGPVQNEPTQHSLQAIRNLSRAGNVGQASRNNQVELHTSNTGTGAIDSVINGIADLNFGGRSLDNNIHVGALRLGGGLGAGFRGAGLGLGLILSNGHLADSQIGGEISVSVVEGQQAIQSNLMLANSVDGAGEGQDHGILGEGSGQVIGTGPHHRGLSPVQNEPTQHSLQAIGNLGRARDVSHSFGNDQVELHTSNAFAGGVDGIVNGIADFCSRNGRCDHDGHRIAFRVNSGNNRQNHCQDHKQC